MSYISRKKKKQENTKNLFEHWFEIQSQKFKLDLKQKSLSVADVGGTWHGPALRTCPWVGTVTRSGEKSTKQTRETVLQPWQPLVNQGISGKPLGPASCSGFMKQVCLDPGSGFIPRNAKPNFLHAPSFFLKQTHAD